MKNKLIKILVGAGILVILVLLFSVSKYFFPAEEQMLTPPLIKPKAIEYTTHELTMGRIENKISVRGIYKHENNFDLSFQNRDGYLKTLNVKSGDRVKSGDILATLDVDSILNDLELQKMNLQGNRESYQQLTEVSVIEISILDIQLKELKKDLENKSQINAGISRVAVTKLENQYKISEFNYDKRVLDYKYQFQTAQRDIDLAILKLKQLEIDLAKATITSPISGVITHVSYINIGEYVTPYKTIITVADPKNLILQYSGNKYLNFFTGMPVKVKSQSEVLDGEVVLTSREVPADEMEKMRQSVNIRISNLPQSITNGDSAKIEALLDWADNVIVIPKKLVHKFSGRKFVKLLQDGLVNERDVEVGIESGTEYEITSGLELTDLVVE